jgi:hypothetical protein
MNDEYDSDWSVVGPPPFGDACDASVIYEWEGPSPHPCCFCGWDPDLPASPVGLVPLWLWSEPTRPDQSGLEWFVQAVANSKSSVP